VTFLELVGGEKQFQVPLYQRTYSWGSPQLEQLWRDIIEHSEGDGAGSSGPGHFLGSVVLAPSPSLQAAGTQRWLVVDGQQRLTTLMLALTAIRDHLAAEGNAAEQDRIHRQYLVNEFRTGDDQLRVLPTQADRDAYRAIVLRTAASSVAGNVGEAYSYFRSALEGLTDSDESTGVVAVEATIRSALSIVEITAERGDNVYRIFESLNNTGLRLSQADLLRNYLFMRLPTRGEDVYRDVWLPMQERLSSRDLELLVWLDLVIRGAERVKQSEIYRVQQERLEGLSDREAVVEAEIGELARRSRHLERLLDPSRETVPQLRGALERLKAWGAVTAYPLVMHLIDLEERGITTSAEVVEALTFVESFLVRRMLCQVPTNNLNRVFNGAPSALGEIADVAPAVRSYLSGRRRYWPTDTELRQSMRSRPFYWTGRPGQRMFVLRRLEESYASAEPVDFDRAGLTIEHVLPQTPTHEWLDLLAADVTDEGGPKELHELLVHTVGNLTLTGENARLSNHPFQRKQDIYQSSSLQMNMEIADTESWGKAEILARADRLAERAASLWPGPIDGVSGDDQGRDWTLLRRACAVLSPGMWTSYGDLAELIGSHPVPVGRYLATHPVQNAWRVLMADGSISPGFHWGDHDRADEPRDVLESEGLLFSHGCADAAQRVTAAELATSLGMEIEDMPDATSAGVTIDSTRGQRFLSLLTEAYPDCVAAVRDLLHNWQLAGGHLAWGRASETSCFLMISVGSYEPRETSALIIYPTAGTIEVTFQYMKSRPVFDDIALRDEFRKRLELAGVTIPEAKLSLRPSLSVEMLRDEKSLDVVKDALDWFALTFQTTLAQADEGVVGTVGG
jgi:alkylated DNA nucleotide flippase Atl1